MKVMLVEGEYMKPSDVEKAIKFHGGNMGIRISKDSAEFESKTSKLIKQQKEQIKSAATKERSRCADHLKMRIELLTERKKKLTFNGAIAQPTLNECIKELRWMEQNIRENKIG